MAAKSGGSGAGPDGERAWTWPWHTIGRVLRAVFGPLLTRGTLALAVLAAFAEGVRIVRDGVTFTRKERRARYLFVCGGDDCLAAALAQLEDCDTILKTLSERTLFTPFAVLLFKRLEPDVQLAQMQAHFTYHKGGLHLLAGELELAKAECGELWESTHGNVMSTTLRDQRERNMSQGRLLGRVGDLKARMDARDAAMRQYTTAATQLQLTKSFVHLRILNNMAIADFADGRDGSAIDQMKTVITEADKYVKELGVAWDDKARKATVDDAMDVWEKESVSVESMVDAYERLGCQHKAALRRIAEPFKLDVVDTLVEGTVFGARDDRIVVEALERAKQGCRKAHTARLNHVRMLALAERSAPDLVKALNEDLETWRSNAAFRAFLALDKQWIACYGADRTRSRLELFSFGCMSSALLLTRRLPNGLRFWPASG